jgi:mRNA interferase MazF
MNYEQYQVVIVNLDPTVGSEIKKSRPCMIVSPDEMNRHLRTITIVPITSQSKIYPSRAAIILQGNQNWAVIDQIRTIDKSRIIKNVGRLTEEIRQVKRVIKEVFVDRIYS